MDVSDELAEKIEERKQMARNREIRKKAGTIPQYLSTPSPLPFRTSKKVSRRYSTEFEDTPLKIEAYQTANRKGPGARHVNVWYDDEHVFSTWDRKIEMYRPGRWEEQIEELYEDALAAKEAYKREQRVEELHDEGRELWEEAQKWGLDLEKKK